MSCSIELYQVKSKNLFLYVSHKDNVKEANPGCIRTIIFKDPIKLPFGKADTNVTLLLYDRVEFHLLTNVITKEQRATNIKPKTPDTFQLTKEVRETVSGNFIFHSPCRTHELYAHSFYFINSSWPKWAWLGMIQKNVLKCLCKECQVLETSLSRPEWRWQ